MENQLRQSIKELLASKSWGTWAIAGGICLIATTLKALLVILGIGFFLRALYLAYPELLKKYKDVK